MYVSFPFVHSSQEIRPAVSSQLSSNTLNSQDVSSTLLTYLGAAPVKIKMENTWKVTGFGATVPMGQVNASDNSSH